MAVQKQFPAATGVTLPTTMTRLTLADALSTADPNSRLVTAITDGGAGAGIEAQLTGGWSSSDPFDGPHIIWRPKDAEGAIITSTTDIWSMIMELAERTAPGLSSDTAVIIGIINESADSGTVDGAYVGIRYTGASRNGLRGSITAGVSTMTHGVASASIRYIQTPIYRQGITTVALLPAPGFPLDTNRAFLSGAGLANTTSISTAAFGDSAPYIFMAFLRTAATAGSETIRTDAYYSQPVHIPITA
jgi:hypothetical protein